ncbi:MAG TPA: phosphotransferase [Thermoanaerobaculia bacterium]|nr:phosphotransferase [Thermoanaerobaculia bacterium]
MRDEHDRAHAEVGDWLAGCGFHLRELVPLPGDVSPRRYARLVARDRSTAILATYPPEIHAVCRRFLRTTEILATAGIAVPRVLAAACERGWMLLEDLGSQTLADLKELPWSETSAYFDDASALAGRIARLPAEALRELNPPLGRELLERELAQTWEFFLEPQGLVGERSLAADLSVILDSLCAGLAAGPQVPCHRDFMARNLMPCRAGKVAVLDHQDLRLGPSAYDLASLLNDTLFPPAELEERLLAGSAFVADRTCYHRAAAQRTLKAVGTYAAFARKGSCRHLPLIAPTLRRFVSHLARLPESAALAADLDRAWAPALSSLPGDGRQQAIC